ncbi:MAG: ABC transporter ATP-binding protein [archaeon]|nr:ABC transporter ATP-binding protein [archaeon]
MKKYDAELDIYVKITDLTKKFGDFTAVSNINLEIRKGEIVGFLGPNGAGKSTTMKMMAYLLKPTSGEVWIRDDDHLQQLTRKNKDALLNNIGFLIENPYFYENMTARQILTYFAGLKGYPTQKTKKRVEEVVEMVGLSDWIDKKVGTYSKGMRQKIGIMSAIVHDPDIIILDEPNTGLDPKARIEVREIILNLKSIGKTIFLSSHLLYEVSEVADKVAIISNGKIIAFDTLDNLESIVKKSIIQLKLYDISESEIEEINVKLNQIVEPLSGISNNPHKSDFVNFNPDLEIFELKFNGEDKNQLAIHDQIFKEGFKILEFSVPRAGLLEDLYLDFISNPKAENDKTNYNMTSNDSKQQLLVE